MSTIVGGLRNSNLANVDPRCPSTAKQLLVLLTTLFTELKTIFRFIEIAAPISLFVEHWLPINQSEHDRN